MTATSTGHNSILKAALDCANRGLYVFPLAAGGKTPAVSGWQEWSTTDETKIKAYWEQYPDHNIGVYARKSGLVILDYDVKNGNDGLYIRNSYGATHIMPVTWTVRTPSGGMHEYYKVETPAGDAVGVHPGVDVRGAGYVVAPGSIINGKPYYWENHPAIVALASATAEVYAFIKREPIQSNRNAYKVPETIGEGARTSSLVALAGMLIAKGVSPETAEAAIRSENELKCNPPLTDEELESQVFPSLYREKWQINVSSYSKDQAIDAALLDKVKTLDPANNKRYGMNDAGNALLFVDVCGDSVRYMEDRRVWVAYDGKRWDMRGDSIVKERLKQLANVLQRYTLESVQDESKRTECLKFYAKWQMHNYRETILKDACSVRPIKYADFDKGAYLLNCSNGTLDLNTLQFREHSPEDHISKVAGVEYVPGARSERWEQFIDEVTCGNKELAGYIQKALGYSLTGANQYECFFILYGATSRNGKSTLTETFSTLMGDYSATARPESIAKKKYNNASGASEDIARLAGARFVNMAEPPKNMELDAAFVKSLTGRDTIKARNLYESSFEFVPVFKLFLNSNYRPRVDDLTIFNSNRIKVIPFNKHFEESDRDPYLKDKLTTNASLSGILNWCIEGLAKLRVEGLKSAQIIDDATAEYRRKEDKLGQFLEEKTESGAEFETTLTDLHSIYSEWCMASGLMSVGMPKFREQLEERQFLLKRKRPKDKTKGNNPLWMALGLKITTENGQN